MADTSHDPDDTIGDQVAEWRQKSRQAFKRNRVMKMAFGYADAHKKPSEYNPEDYIPRIPAALKQKYSKDPVNVSNSDKSDLWLESPEKKNKSSRANKSKSNKSSRATKNDSSLTDKENRTNSHNDKSVNNRSARRVLGESQINTLDQSTAKASKIDKSGHFRSESPASSENNVSDLAPLRRDNQGNPASPSSDMITKFNSKTNKYGSASKQRSHHKSLDHINRMIHDSKSNKKPSEYNPEDFIPRTAQIAKKEAALKAAKEDQLREEAKLKAMREQQAREEATLQALKAAELKENALRREIAELEEAEARDAAKKSSDRKSRKSLFNKSKNKSKIQDVSASDANNSSRVMTRSMSTSQTNDLGISPAIELKNSMAQGRSVMRSRNTIADTSDDASEAEEEIVQRKKSKNRTFNKTKDVIPDTQPNRTINRTTVVKDTQSPVAQKSYRSHRPRVKDSSQESMSEEQAMKASTKTKRTPPPQNMANLVAKKHLNKKTKEVSNSELAITPILTRTQKSHKQQEPEYSYIDESLLNEDGRTRKSVGKSDKYKMSSTANTSNQLHFTFNNANADMQSTRLPGDISQYDEEDIATRKSKRSIANKSITKTAQKEQEDAPVIEPIPTVSPAKRAFETSLRRRSSAAHVDKEQKLVLENDETIVSSGNAQKQTTKSKIEISKIPRPAVPPVPESTPILSNITHTKGNKNNSTNSIHQKSADIPIDLSIKQTKKSAKQKPVLKDQSVLDENDEMELAAAQSNLFIRKSFTKSINSTTMRSINATHNLQGNANNQTITKTRSSSNLLTKKSSFSKNPFNLPQVPSFPETTPTLPPVASQRKEPSVSPRKKSKKETPPLPPPVEDQLEYDETVGEIFSDTHVALPQHEPAPEPVDMSLERHKFIQSNKELLLSKKNKKQSPEVTKETKKSKKSKEIRASSQESTQSEGYAPQPSSSTKASKQKKSKKSENKENMPKPSKSSVVTKSKQRAVATSDDANDDTVSPQKKLKKSVSKSKGLVDRDLNKMVKRTQNEADIRRRTIYDLEAFKQNVNEFEEEGPRRSKRVKIDKLSAPVYQFEEITDFSGKTIMVQHLVGVTKKNYPNKYAQLMTGIMKEKEKEKKKNKTKNKRKRVENEDETEVDNSANVPVDIDSHTEQVHETIHINKLTQDQTISLSQWEKGAVNQSQETVIFEHEDGDESDMNPRKKVFGFRDRLASKKYENCYPGVSLHVLSSSDGILRIDPLGETKTQNHSNLVTYYLQKGGPCVMSLNENVSRHVHGDIIKIPSDVQYKIRNISKTEKAYFHFQFM